MIAYENAEGVDIPLRFSILSIKLL